MERGACVKKVEVNQVGVQNIINAPPKKEFLQGDETLLIKEIKSYYQEKNMVEIAFTERGISIEKGGYINLAIVKEEEQRKKENEAMNKEDIDSNKNKSEGKVFTDKRITSFEDIYGTKTPIELENIFVDGKSDKKGFNSALLLGRAGIGKSTVCQYIAYQWANKKLWKNEFDLVIWIPLRNLMGEKYKKNTINWYEVIYEECFTKEFKDENGFDLNAFIECFKKIPEDKILYVLDGYDEIAHLRNDTPAREVIAQVFLKKRDIILTSRPHYLKENPFLHKENAQFQRVETIGFSDENIENYVELFFKETDLEEKSDKTNKSKIYSDSLKQFFKNAPNAKGIAHIPINLALICQAWKEHYDEINKIKNKNFTLSMLYQGLLQSLCIRYLNKFQGEIEITDKSWNFVSKEGKCLDILEALKIIAFQQMSQESLIIENTKIREVIKEKNDKYLLNGLLNFGLLKSVNDYHVEKEKQSYYFIHLTFQEYLAAYYIADRLKVKDIEIQKFIKSNKYQPRYEIMWWFVAGFLKEKQDEEARELFFDCLEDEKSKDIAGSAHQCLMIRCFDECSEVEDDHFKKRKEDFIAQLCLQIIASAPIYLLVISEIIFNYLCISPNIFNHVILKEGLVELFKNNGRHNSRDFVRALYWQSPLPEYLLEELVNLLENNGGLASYAANVLARQSSLPEHLLKKFPSLLKNTDIPRLCAVRALEAQSSLPEYILKEFPGLSKDVIKIKGDVVPVLERQSSLRRYHKVRDFRRGTLQALQAQSSFPQDMLNGPGNLSNSVLQIGLSADESVGSSAVSPFRESVLYLINKVKNTNIFSEMEQIVKRCIFKKIPIYKDLENKKNIFVGVTKFQFETSAQRTEFIKTFKKEVMELAGIKVVSTEQGKVSEFFGGFFNKPHPTSAKEKNGVDKEKENTDNEDICLVM